MSYKEWMTLSVIMAISALFFILSAVSKMSDSNDPEALAKSTMSLYEHMSKICAYPVGLNITTGSESTMTLTCRETLTKVDSKVK